MDEGEDGEGCGWAEWALSCSRRKRHFQGGNLLHSCVGQFSNHIQLKKSVSSLRSMEAALIAFKETEAFIPFASLQTHVRVVELVGSAAAAAAVVHPVLR